MRLSDISLVALSAFGLAGCIVADPGRRPPPPAVYERAPPPPVVEYGRPGYRDDDRGYDRHDDDHRVRRHDDDDDRRPRY